MPTAVVNRSPDVRYLVAEAPHQELRASREFELYEGGKWRGNRKTGVIFSPCGLRSSKRQVERDGRVDYGPRFRRVFPLCLLPFHTSGRNCASSDSGVKGSLASTLVR